MSGNASPAASPTAPGGTTPAFRAMGTVIAEGAGLRERGNAAGLRALGPRLSRTGLALLRARMPHDLRRSDVAHFLDARAAFGDAMKAWVRAVEGGGDDAGLFRAFEHLAGTYRGWVDASMGLPPERAV